MPDQPTATNESYEIKRIEEVASACVAAFMHQLGSPSPPRSGAAWDHESYIHFLTTDQWRKDNQKLWFHYDHHDGRKSEGVEFVTPFYGPESDFTEGTPKLLQNVDLNVDGLTKVFDNSRSRDPLHIAYEQAVELVNSVSVGVKQEFTFDLTVSEETTISGSYGGASLEQKLSTEVHTGFSKETSRDESESKTASDAVAIEFDCPAGAIKQVVCTKQRQRELIPVKGVFVVDFGMRLKLRHWWNHGAGGVQFRESGQDLFEVDSVQGLYNLMRGVDTNYPHLSGFWQSAGACTPEVRNGMLHLLHPANRSYYLDADKLRVIENNANYSVSDLESTNHGNGAVIDLSDEQNRDAYGKAA